MLVDSSPHLFVLTKCNHWIVANRYGYDETYKSIKNILDNKQNNTQANINKYLKYNDVETKILKIELHRMCVVVYCLQQNLKTGTFRYMVYGTRYNEIKAADYGIGTCLDGINTTGSLKYCPKINCIKFVD